MSIYNSFFSGPNGAPNPLRGSINKLFDKYRDDPKNEPDEINAEGTQKILGEMNIGLDDIGSFVFSELVQSPTLGKITRDGFVEGCLEVNADSITKIRNVVSTSSLPHSFSNETALNSRDDGRLQQSLRKFLGPPTPLNPLHRPPNLQRSLQPRLHPRPLQQPKIPRSRRRHRILDPALLQTRLRVADFQNAMARLVARVPRREVEESRK